MKLLHYEVGGQQPFFLIAGPCVIESEEMAMSTASTLKEMTDRLGIPFIYKSSFDKANRTSSASQRGPGRDKGLDILARVKQEVGVPVLTDVHSVADVEVASKYVDVIQTPAFLCRQTDLIEAVGRGATPCNIKKGQFLSPGEMKHVVAKAKAVNADAPIMVCERGSSFGYNNLVVDMRSLEIMRETGCPVVFDATHSVQLPGGGDGKSDGQRQFVPTLARAAVGVGVAGLFMETHPDPDNAFSDGPNAMRLDQMESLLQHLQKLDQVVKNQS